MLLAPPALATPPTLDDLGSSLFDVTFVVVDLETTGGSPAACEITEIGAVKYRGGEPLGTFQTLVNPGVAVPPFISLLTGITDSMLVPAPRVAEVLPALLEFIGGAVLVGHNLRFDTAFLDAALVRHGYAPLANRRVDTLSLARRLLRDEVLNHKLGTLARHFGTAAEPSHRALDDASATAEVLHALIEDAAGFAVSGLDDLLAVPKVRDHRSSTKLALTARLPREPGVFWMRDRSGTIVHVGRADNLRTRVRSYFTGRRRGAQLQLLRELHTVEHVVCRHGLEAAVRELRLVRRHRPRHNPPPSRRVYVKLTVGERYPRVTVVRSRPRDGGVFLGPLPSTVWAQRVKDGIEAAVPLRRCTTRLPATAPVCCPCGGSVDAAHYDRLVEQAIAVFTGDSATDSDAVAAAVERRQRLETYRRVGRLRIVDGAIPIEIDGGRLVLPDSPADGLDDRAPTDADEDADVEEVLLVGRWLDRSGQVVGSRGRMRVR
jgi:DNA polymerase-3 subunit epsilon